MNFMEAVQAAMEDKVVYSLYKNTGICTIFLKDGIYFKFAHMCYTAMLCISIDMLLHDNWEISQGPLLKCGDSVSPMLPEEDPNSWNNKGRFEK